MDVNEPGVKIEDISVAFISCMNDFFRWEEASQMWDFELGGKWKSCLLGC